MKHRGHTLIELMVGVVFVAVLFLIAAPIIFGSPTNNVSWGINGMTESRCIEGYRFVIGERGQPRQIIDEFGKGVRCELIESGKPGSFGRM